MWLSMRCVDAARDGWRLLVRSARLAIGMPDYATYLAHVREQHPDAVPMSRGAFFAERMRSRYARGRSRCC